MVSTAVDLLAQLPSSAVYVNPIKLAALTLCLLYWVLLAQWMDKDAIVVNTFRTLWNLISVACGTVAFAVSFLVPVFWIGLSSALLVHLVLTIVYVVHRNHLVKEEDRVLTAAHFRRLREEGIFSKKKKVKEVKERVRLTAHNRKVVPVPEEEQEREQYRLTQDLLFDALWRRAALVEVAPAGQVAKVTYEIDGLPVEREPLSRGDGEAILLFLKHIAGLSLEEHRKPQKGEILLAVGENRHKTIVRTDGSTAGEKLTIRIVYRETSLKVPDLGFNPRQLESVTALKEITRGVILISAPQRAGLTTSIYSFVRTHDRYLQNVQTIEFEKELELENVTQSIYSPAAGKPFVDVLLKIVRSDPDIIVLPELRDRESAAIAAKAGVNKQKIYVGLVASDVFEALRKWLSLVGDKGLVAKSLLAFSNQRLVRTLCNECKQAYKPDAQMMRKLNLPAEQVLYRVPEPQYDKHGNPIICQVCQGSGYVGRSAVIDWMVVDDGLREVIAKSASFADVQNYLTKKGGLGLQPQAIEKVLAGQTSIQEIARVLRESSGGSAAGGASAAGAGGGAAPRPQPRPKPKTPAGPGPT